MAYDSIKPVNGTPIVATELRNQFAGLNDDLQPRALAIDMQDEINAQTSGSVASLPPPSFTVSNPPPQVQGNADYLNQRYVALSRK